MSIQFSSSYHTKPSQLIRQRYSCRTYQKRPISDQEIKALEAFALRCAEGPFGNQTRFMILPASDYDPRSFPKLGTYGFIKDPAAFIAGTIPAKEPGALEDFGYSMELLILMATDLGLGTCWLGGTFTKSRFSAQMDLQQGETIPSVASLGYPANQKAWVDRVARTYAGADRRLPWGELFYKQGWDEPLPQEQAGDFLEPLHLLRLAPSASNKQPWRILQDDQNWHFYLERTPSYPSRVFNLIVDLSDLQRIDMGIAMAHFELGLKESGRSGKWISADPGIINRTAAREYIVSWQPIPK